MATFDEIREGFDNLVLDAVEYANSLPDGSEEKSKTIMLSLLRNMVKKQQIIREKQMKQQHKEFIQKTVVDTATTGVKLVVFGVVGKWAGNLETIGTISSNLGRNVFKEGWNLLNFRK